MLVQVSSAAVWYNCLAARTRLEEELHCSRKILFIFNNQPDALIIQIYSVIKLYMFRESSLLIIRSFPLYIRHR